MYKFVVKENSGVWIEVPPVKEGHNPILDQIQLNQLDNTPQKMNEGGRTIFVNPNGGWHTGNGEETFDTVINSDTLEFPFIK